MSNEKETKVSALDAKAKALANEEDEDTKIVPFAFVYRPAILLEGTMVEIIIAYCIVIAATYLLACGIAGYLFRPLKMWERIACYVVAFIFILPSSMSDIIGIAGCVLIMAYCFMTGKKNANKAQPA